jgi:hypothetical protein
MTPFMVRPDSAEQTPHEGIAARDGTEGLTVSELARRTGTHDRCVREWLEQQGSVGILDVAEEEAGSGARRSRLSPAHAEVLADPESLNSYFFRFCRLRPLCLAA